jgi:FkbM family methyltransferase
MNQIDKFIDQIDLYIGRKNVLNVLEAGANDGADSLNLADAFPNAIIHSFECNPESIPKCLAVRHDRIKFTPIALGEENGEKLFLPIDTGRTITPHVDGNPGASSFYKANKDYSFETYIQTEAKVPIKRVDSLDFPLWIFYG